jgi:hypothetical protein
MSFPITIPVNTVKKKCPTVGNPTAVDKDGFLLDIDVQDINDDLDVPSREDKRRDVDEFFEPAVVKEVNGKQKKYCACKLCP